MTRDVPAGSARPLAELIHDAMPRMSSAERRVAHVLLSDLPGGALGTVKQLASSAQVSTATVVRFCRRIGIGGFAELNSLALAEISRSKASPVVRARSAASSVEFDRQLRHRAQLVDAAAASLPVTEVDSAVALLADTRRTVVTVGGSLSQLAARYLQLQMRHVRPAVHHISDPDVAELGMLLDLRRRDVVVLFDFRRYEDRAARVAELARSRGAVIVLVTDTWLSPLARVAEVTLPVDVEASFLDSLTAVFALVEVLVPAVANRVGDPALTRMEAIEDRRLG